LSGTGTDRAAACRLICYSGNRNCPDVSGNSRSSRSRNTVDGEARGRTHDAHHDQRMTGAMVHLYAGLNLT
jgi:hypothetical protein